MTFDVVRRMDLGVVAELMRALWRAHVEDEYYPTHHVTWRAQRSGKNIYLTEWRRRVDGKRSVLPTGQVVRLGMVTYLRIRLLLWLLTSRFERVRVFAGKRYDRQPKDYNVWTLGFSGYGKTADRPLKVRDEEAIIKRAIHGWLRSRGETCEQQA